MRKSWKEGLLGWIKKNEWLMVILAVVIFLRIPSLFEPHRYADEEIYLTLGQGLRKGLMLYRDIHDNKPPMLYLTAAVAGDVFWFRLILMAVNGVNVVVLWKLAELIWGKKKWAVRLATALFGIFSSIPMFEGNIANAENFFILFTTAGVYLLFRAIKEKERRPGREFLLVGLLFAVGFLYKVPVAFDFLGVMLFWWFLVNPKQKIRDLFVFLVNPKVWLTVVGFLVPILLSIGYFALQGVAEPYVRAALFQNVGYVGSWRGGSGLRLSNPLFWRGLVVVGAGVSFWILRKKVASELMLVGMWLVFSFYGAILSSRPYPHYLLEVIPAMSLLVPFIVVEKERVGRIAVGALMLIAVVFYGENNFWYYKSLAYYQNFVEYVLGQKSREEYFGFWEGVNQNYEIGEYIKGRTLAEDRIFVWGTEPSIYTIADRLPVGRYIVEYHIVDFNAFEETIEVIEKEKAEIIVVMPDAREFKKLDAMLGGDSYLLETEIGEASLYRYVNGLKHNGEVDKVR